MADAFLCPGCRGPILLSQEVCGACRRPLGDDEREAWREAALRRAESRRKLPRKVAGWLALAACVAALYAVRGPALERVTSVRVDLARQFKEAAQPKKSDKPLSPMAQQLVETLASRRVEHAESAGLTSTSPAPAAPAAPAPPRVVKRMPEPAKPAANKIAKRVYGVVYNLRTLEPVVGAVVDIQGGGQTYQVATDGDGRYLLDLHGACGDAEFLVEVAAPGVREGQLEDTDPPYFERTAEQRQQTLEQLAPSDLVPFPLRCKASALFVELNLLVVPKPD